MVYVAISINVNIFLEDVYSGEDWVDVCVVVLDEEFELFEGYSGTCVADVCHVILYKLTCNILQKLLSIKSFKPQQALQLFSKIRNLSKNLMHFVLRL